MAWQNFDSEAFEAVASCLLNGRSVRLKFQDNRAAQRFRHKFYGWRKMEQTLRDDPMWLSRVMVAVRGDEVVMQPSGVDEELREALRGGGIL